MIDASFWPKRNRFFAPLAGIAPGEVAVVDVSMPGRIKLSTGVLVMYADEESFTLMTPQGHMFADWIVCVDRRRHWGNAGNLWHNAGIRSGMYTAAAPVRFATRPFRRGGG
jgi:hypothetical protein